MNQYAKLKSIKVVCGEIFFALYVNAYRVQIYILKNFVVDNKSNDDVWPHTSPPWSDLHE